MKFRIMSFIFAFTMLLSLSPVHSYALENEGHEEGTDLNGENNGDNLAAPNAVASSTWTAVTMQGDTDSASDCKAFEDALTISDNGYGDFLRCGWKILSGEVVHQSPMVSQGDLVSARYYDVAYYSGHGGSASDDIYDINQPCLNYNSSEEKKIFVANTFDIADNDWASTTIIRPSNRLRVLVLASCNQLDDLNAKFYARLMKVSGIRAIPGYYSTAPSNGDDSIAFNFVLNCNNGNSVASAWGNANSGHPWAVLVYFSNNNQYYRLPGFPGATYSAPASNADVYIIKATVQNIVETAAYPVMNDELMDTVEKLPLTILTADSPAKTDVKEFSREAVWNSVVPNGESVVRKALASELGDIGDKMLVEYHVTKEVVDPDIGVLHETNEIIERTYRYYDTFKGIKLADSFVEGSVDSQGLSRITVQKKNVISGAVTASTMTTGSTGREKIVSNAEALKLLIAECPGLEKEELRGAYLAYAPDGNGNHVLTYEFLIGGCFYYVSVTDGEILWF